MRIAAAIAIAACLLAGCGSSNAQKSADAYARAVNRAQAQFSRALLNQARLLRKSGKQTDDVHALNQAVAVIDRDVAQLKRIKPPTAVRSAHTRLIQTVSAYGLAVQEAARLVATGRPANFSKARSTLQAASAKAAGTFSSIAAQINNALS